MRGRPKKENPRNLVFKVRLTQKEYDYLHILSKERNMSMSEVIRKCLYWNWNKKMHEHDLDFSNSEFFESFKKCNEELIKKLGEDA